MTTDQQQHGAGQREADTAGQPVLFGPFRLEPARQLLLEDGRPVSLGSRALGLLTALTEQAGAVVSNRDLVARVWPGLFVEDSNLRVHVAGLRKALRDGQDGQRYVVNVPGRGYSFVAPVQPAAPEGAGRETWSSDARPSDARPEDAATGGLPRASSRLIGRTDLVEAVCRQFAQRRFVTLVGPGGIGKTTVALAVAHRLAAGYRDGVCFVDLTAVHDPALVPGTLAAALGMSVPSREILPAVAAHLASRHLLLVLDNCEHVIEPAADAAESIVTAASALHVLATSREPLRAAGERVHRLPPLEMPPPSAVLTAAEAMSFPTVQLFAERVAGSLGDFTLEDADAPFVAEICQKLDGIPLAVELAAARVEALGIRELAGRLDDRFRLLTSGRRTALPRHQTLAATLDWSYGLLPPEEQVVLRRLSVFAGGFSLDGAAAVAAEPSARPGVPAAVASLVSKSLVVAEWGSEGARYHLLETTRLYGAEKLRGDAGSDQVFRAHAEHVRNLVGGAGADAETMPTEAWRSRYAREVDNLRRALGWSGAPGGDPALYVSLCIAAVPLWVRLSLMAECRAFVERGLEMVGSDSRAALDARMRLTAARGWSLMYSAGRASDIGDTWAATLDLAEKLDDTEYRVRAIWGVWIGRLNRGELDDALLLAARLLDLVRDSSSDTDRMLADRLMATTLHYRGDQAQARHYIERMLDRYAAAPRQPRLASFHVDQRVPAGYFRARILWLQGLSELAALAVRQNLEEGLALGHALSFGSVLGQAACPIALLTGDLPAARRHGAALLDHAGRHSLHLWHDWARCYLGLVAFKEGDVENGLETMRSVFEAAGDSRFLPRYMLLLAEYAAALGRAGQVTAGVETLDAMLDRSARTGERWYEPELIRLRAELLLPAATAGARDAAEAAFIRAMRMAADQGARAWELRAATSMARLRRAVGDPAGAQRVLQPVLAAFSEGFATADLREAAALMSDLAEAPA